MNSVTSSGRPLPEPRNLGGVGPRLVQQCSLIPATVLSRAGNVTQRLNRCVNQSSISSPLVGRQVRDGGDDLRTFPPQSPPPRRP